MIGSTSSETGVFSAGSVAVGAASPVSATAVANCAELSNFEVGSATVVSQPLMFNVGKMITFLKAYGLPFIGYFP